MDMKRILQAMDGVATKPVEGANDMKKFLQVVTEGANPHKVSLPVQMAMQHYQKPAEPKVVKKPSVIGQYFQEAEAELIQQKDDRRRLLNQYANIIAERVLMKENYNPAISPNPGFKPGPGGPGLMPATTENQGAQSPHRQTLEHLEKLHIHVKQKVDELYRYAEDINSHLYGLHHTVEESGLGNDVYDVSDSINESIEAAKHLSSQILGINEAFKYHLRDMQNRIDDDEYNEMNESKEDKPQKPRNFVAKNAMATTSGAGAHRDKKKEQKQGKEKHKGKLASMMEDPCWDKYKQVGMKKKGKRMVPNCVPKK